MTEQEEQRQLDNIADLIQKMTTDFPIPLISKLLDAKLEPIKHQLNRIQSTTAITHEEVTTIITDLEERPSPPEKI